MVFCLFLLDINQEVQVGTGEGEIGQEVTSWGRAKKKRSTLKYCENRIEQKMRGAWEWVMGKGGMEQEIEEEAKKQVTWRKEVVLEVVVVISSEEEGVKSLGERLGDAYD